LVPAVNLLIVGDGPDRKKLEQLINQKGLNNRTVILGQVSPDRIPNLLKGADIFCRPSRTEGLGNSFLEAMACGLPTIGTPVGGIVDFLIDKQTGFLVPPNNPTALVEKIKYLIDKSKIDEIKEIADRGRRLVNEKYNWQSIAGHMGEIFSGLA
jgi:L-malate glycosyltransferase